MSVQKRLITCTLIIEDVIMDVLGHPKLRQIILEYYETLDEPVMVRRAVQDGINREKNTKNLLQMVLFGAEKVSK